MRHDDDHPNRAAFCPACGGTGDAPTLSFMHGEPDPCGRCDGTGVFDGTPDDQSAPGEK